MPFKKGRSGNPNGRGKGSKTEKTLQWEALGESIVNRQAGYFNEYLENLWLSSQPSENEKAANLYLQTLEFFKPKHARTEVKQEGAQDIFIRVVEE